MLLLRILLGLLSSSGDLTGDSPETGWLLLRLPLTGDSPLWTAPCTCSLAVDRKVA